MKICDNCENENFIRYDYCERCGHPITHITPESFNIANFLRRNYQLYATFGILVAIFEYLLRDLPDERKYWSIFPLLVAMYLIVHLGVKGAQVIRSRIWLANDDSLHRESNFHLFIFLMIHSLLIIGLILSLPENTRNFAGFALGAFIFLVFFSSDFSNAQSRRSYWILLFGIFYLEIVITLILLLPFIAKVFDNGIVPNLISETVAVYYGWITISLFYLGIGGMITYYISFIGSEPTNFRTLISSIFYQERNPDYLSLEFFSGIVLLYGIILCFFLLDLKSLYSGF
jgi:hypothetical protein